MPNPYKVEVLFQEHVTDGDDDPYHDDENVEFLVGHVQHVHDDALDPAQLRADSINILRSVQLASGALSVLLCAIAQTDTQAAMALVDEITEQLSSHVAVAPGTFIGDSRPPGAPTLPDMKDLLSGFDGLSDELKEKVQSFCASPAASFKRQ